MAKYSERFKIEMAREGAQGALGLRELARKHGLDYSMVRRWVESYRRHGAAGLQKKHSHYDVAFKLHVLQRIRDEALTQRQAAALFQIRSTATIGIWQRQYDQGDLGAWAPATKRHRMPRKHPADPLPKPAEEMTREELLKELAYLRAETAYLKKLDALIQAEQPAAHGKKRKPSKD